ncbi:uroporphyrinogen-III synthase [Microbacterium sediminis]|uniref:Uroporphyrinogen-III synthase n=1 Tax=Microbacterium sediminis TaxID=904291 RepID=A0A1B9NF93_9MICO|nr:uroporphyrinogen-III synthase [Microbacterium sediminis]OCG75271.1 uroporphyrinogen-III synthase [Microbacterium sediminis]QBR74289.1 uroporphyrinogen-III synthase [Microbacterium sediminis]
MTAGTTARLSSALEGCRIVIAVDRRSSELTAALQRHGASVMQAPALTIESHIDDDALLERTAELIAHPPDIVVATTGVGFRGWIEAADEADLLTGLEAALAGAQIVARGPKARGAIQQAGFTADWVAESETAAELGAYLVAEGVAGKRIAVQHHGSGADGLDELFTAHGADVVSLTVYRWGPPPDPEPVRRSVLQAAAGEVDAVLFTSAPGASEWLAEARRATVIDALRDRAERGRLVMAAVGPVTVVPLQEAAIPALIAERGRLGSLVRTVVTHFGGGHAPGLATACGRLELRSGGAVLGGRFIALSPAGVALLDALFDAGGAVVTRAALQEALPGAGRNAHAVEMAIARLREALAAPELIKTVVKRGYRLNVEDPE